MTDYGNDCASLWGPSGSVDLDPFFSIITGKTAVAHAVARRFVTQRGQLWWDRIAGYDLRDLLNEGLLDTSLGALNAMRQQIEEEAGKDERVGGDTAKVSFTSETQSLTVELTCRTVENETFTLVLKVADMTVTLLAIS